MREGLTSAQIGRGDQQWIPAVLHADPTACLPHGKDGSDAVAPARAGELRACEEIVVGVVTWPPRVAETYAVSRLRGHLRPVTKTEVVLPRLQTRERERFVRLSLQVVDDGPGAVSARPARRRLRPMGQRPLRQETN